MGRAYKYVLFFTALTLLMQFAGFGVVGADLLARLGITDTVIDGSAPYNLNNTSFWVALVAILAAGIGGGIAIGFLTKSPSENYVVLPVILTTFIFFADAGIGILGDAHNYEPWMTAIIYFIMIPITTGFIFTMVEWFRGNN